MKSKAVDFGMGVGAVIITWVSPYLSSYLNLYNTREAFEAFPVLLYSFFIFRYTVAQQQKVTGNKRQFYLAAPLLVVIYGISIFPTELIALDIATILIIVVNAIAIGITEEMTFRYSLHRLAVKYGIAFYVVTSSVVFGLLHFQQGLPAIILTATIGALFALARVAGMPILVLILVHGLVALPGVIFVMEFVQ